MTLTNRLSLFFLTTLGIVLIGFSTSLYLLAKNHLHRQAEERLLAVMNTLIAAAEISPQGVEWEPNERRLNFTPGISGDELVWLVRDDRGNSIDKSNHPATEDLLNEASAKLNEEQRSTRKVNWEGQRWQVLQQWVITPSGNPLIPSERQEPGEPTKYPALVVVVGVPLTPIRTALWELLAILAILSGSIWIAAFFLNRIVCRRALRPVTKMAESARSMNGENLEERLPAPKTHDEVEELGTAFNLLLGRVQESYERQQQFTGNASHQLRTPLTAILGQLEVTLRRPRPIEEYHRALTTVYQKSGHLKKIIDALLFLSRADLDARLPDLEPIELSDWLSQYRTTWQEHSRHGDIQFETLTDPIWIKAQPVLLGELLNVLLDNACKYSPSGTAIHLRLLQANQEAILEIEDHGFGIRAEDQANLFKPFFRSEESRKKGLDGLGLGLAIASRLVTAFQGHLEVTSELGKGSCFRIRLPLFTPSTQPDPSAGTNGHFSMPSVTLQDRTAN